MLTSTYSGAPAGTPGPCYVPLQHHQFTSVQSSVYAFRASGSDVLAEFHYSVLLHEQAAGLASG